MYEARSRGRSSPATPWFFESPNLYFTAVTSAAATAAAAGTAAADKAATADRAVIAGCYCCCYC